MFIWSILKDAWIFIRTRPIWAWKRAKSAWDFIRDLLKVLNRARVSLLTVIIAGFALLLIDQGPEALASLADSSHWYQVAFFFLALFLWAGSSWYWARIMMLARFGSAERNDLAQFKYPARLRSSSLGLHYQMRRERFRKMVKITPRVLGLAPFAITALALFLRWHAGTETSWLWIYAVICILLLFLFRYFFIRRHRWSEQLAGKPGWREWVQATNPRPDQWSDLPRLARWLIIFVTVIGVLSLLWASLAPARMGWYMGAAAVLYFAFALYIPLISILVFATKRARFPVLTSLLLWAIFLSLWVDNHGVRRFGPDGLVGAKRPTIEEAAKTWLNHMKDLHQNGSTVPLVVVATAGGASRAAYWTGLVLASLQECKRGVDQPPSTPCLTDFSEHIFAISSVSGGSLGAAAFVTLAGHADELRHPDTGEKITLVDSIRWFLGQDFLSPVLVGMLYPDVVQRFMPYAFLPDRAESLERGWEHAWQAAFAATPPLAAAWETPFLSLWPEAAAEQKNIPSQVSDASVSPEASPATPSMAARSVGGGDVATSTETWRPALFLNGTHEETGKRVITSNIVIDRKHFVDAVDFYDYFNGEVRLSTAVLNTARFPYISPAGTLHDAHDLDEGHIVDGGYFENFGARTASEILAAVLKVYGEGYPFNLKPIVIQISSDPDLTEADVFGCGNVAQDGAATPEVPAERLDNRQWLNDLAGPPVGLSTVRTSRGILETKLLCRQVQHLIPANSSSSPVDKQSCQGDRAESTNAVADALPPAELTTGGIAQAEAGATLPQSNGARNANGVIAPMYFHFRLCRREGEFSPALTWYLSKGSRKWIDNSLNDARCDCNNVKEFGGVIKAMQGNSTPSCAGARS